MERDAQNISDFELLEHFKEKRGYAEHATRGRVNPKNSRTEITVYNHCNMLIADLIFSRNFPIVILNGE